MSANLFALALTAFACTASATAITKCARPEFTKASLLAAIAADNLDCDCPANCATCVNGDECKTVLPGFYLKADKTAGACATGCTGCTDATIATCTGCATGYIALTDKSCSLIDVTATWCKTWAKDTAGTGIECTALADDHFGSDTAGVYASGTACATGCSGCTDATIGTCTGCKAGYIALTDKSCSLIDVTAEWCGTWVKDTAGTGIECSACAASPPGTLVTQAIVDAQTDATMQAAFTLLIGETLSSAGYSKSATAASTVTVMTAALCMQNACEGAKTCTVSTEFADKVGWAGNQGSLAEYEYEYGGEPDASCPAPVVAGTGSSGSGPGSAEKAAAGTIQVSLGLLLAALALVVSAQ